VESPLRDVDGTPISEGRVTTVESYASASRNMLEVDASGQVRYWACFAAGTLVHTDTGLVPIEQVRVGTKVLSQPEAGGDQGYRAVTGTVATLDQQVHAVQIEVEGESSLTTLVVTANHPFWVEERLAHGEHWLAAECLQTGFVLQLADGRRVKVRANGLVRQTQHPTLGFAADDRAGVGIVLNLSNNPSSR
jgi:hypothetical protein